MKSRVTLVLFSMLLACTARDCDEPSYSENYNSPGPVTVKPEFKMEAADFDLETVTGLLKTNQVKNAEELQAKINDPQSGINNVDLDGDKMVDYVAVKEERQDDNHRQINFLAFPSSKNGGDPTLIASTSFQVQNNQVTIASGYPSYVNGYAGASYVSTMPYSGPTFGEMLFLSWMLSPRPVYVYPAYSTFGYHPRGIIAPTVMTTRRETYRSETKVAPIQRQAPPANVGPKFATQSDSRFKPTVSSSNSFSSSGRQAQSFGVRDQSQPKPMATGFGAKPSTPSASSSSSGSSFSRPSSSSGSSWSRPSSSSSSSSFGSSRSSSSSFGSGRSSSFGRR